MPHEEELIVCGCDYKLKSYRVTLQFLTLTFRTIPIKLLSCRLMTRRIEPVAGISNCSVAPHAIAKRTQFLFDCLDFLSFQDT